MKIDTIRACSIWRALEVVGDVPVLLIMEQAFLGKHRFQEFLEETGIVRSVLSNRLAKLVDVDVLSKHTQRQKGYHLTEKGRGLFPVALMILRWQRRWESGARGFEVRMIHSGCGNEMLPEPKCDQCKVEIDPRDVDWSPGPGLSQVTPVYGRRRKQTAAASAKRGNRTMTDSVIELFGDRWATLVVRACFTGINRFDEIQRDTAMATNILSDRLDRLQQQNIIKAYPYSPHEQRFEYRLTDKGRDLYPVLLALLQWGDRWFADEKGPPLILRHKPCDHNLHFVPTCDKCGEALDVSNTGFNL
ncbi:helix-turn-helix domain-containing protein [Parasphingorhabdus sp. JC815]|uniref:winged helix-turn-helix transcriptional regulator n=1 Tax=Parasphingorhabdus sp. JC815 TaxID=3232140 RepID=UPI00345A83F3